MLNCAFKNNKNACHENIDFYNMTHSRSMNKNGRLKFISPDKKIFDCQAIFFLYSEVRTLTLCFIHFRPEVIECLSGEVRQAIVGEKDHKISEECRAQLHVEKMRQV